MDKKYFHHIFLTTLFLFILYLILKPLDLQSASFLNEDPTISFDMDWEKLIDSDFSNYKLQFSDDLILKSTDINSPYEIYQYQNSLLFVNKTSNTVHKVLVRDPNILICDTYVNMSTDEIKNQHGIPLSIEEDTSSNNQVFQYIYGYDNYYNLSTRSLSYSFNNDGSNVLEISYGYTLPLSPNQIGNIDSLKTAKEYLQGQWNSSNFRQLILYNQYLFEQFSSLSNPQSHKNFFVISPNEMYLAHYYDNSVTSLTPLRFLFNDDYNEVFFFSTDKYGIPIESSIEVWNRSP